MTQYTFGKINLPGPAGIYVYISVNGVDTAGLAVGNYGDSNDDFHGFTANSGTPIIFDPPGSSNTNVGGITPSGEIYGNYTNQFNQEVGFTYGNGTFAIIDAPLAEATTVFGISGGEVFGGFVDIFGHSHGFIETNGNFTQIDVPSAVSTTVMGATPSGELAGTIIDSADSIRGFIDNNGSFAIINAPGAAATYVVGVSANGVVAGTYDDSASNQHGFVDASGQISPIVIAGSISTAVTAINASGEVVGYYLDSVGNVHGFVDNFGSIATVDVPGASETNILGVNDAGDIYGYYNDSSGQHGFVGTISDTTPTSVLTTDQVTDVYEAILQRGPTSAELATWLTATPAIDSAVLVSAVVQSAEAQYNVYPIVQIIDLATGNLPTAAQLAGWVPYIEQNGFLAGQSQTNSLLDQMAEAFVASDNFGKVYNNGTDVDPNSAVTAQEMHVIIQAATGIAATLAQVAAWVNTGLSIDQVFVDFALGDQYTAASEAAIQQYLTTVAHNAAGVQMTGISADVNHGSVTHV